MHKKTLRQHMQQKIVQISTTHRQQQSAKVCQKLTSLLSKYKYRCVYISLHDEINITPFIAQLRKRDISVCIPQQNEDLLTLVEYMKDSNITITQNGPIITNTQHVDYTPDILIIPGRAFTSDGKRLGRGKGGYDKLLATYPDSYKVGICFHEQIVNDMPTQAHDITMDEVLYT